MWKFDYQSIGYGGKGAGCYYNIVSCILWHDEEKQAPARSPQDIIQTADPNAKTYNATI
jgi:hypothetical protein